MANEENLIRPEDLTSKELRERAKKGGKASVAARRRKKDMKAKMKLLLSLKPTQNQSAILDALGIPEEDADNEMLMLVAMFQATVEDRDTKAFDKVMDILGKTTQREELALKKKALQSQNKTAENPNINVVISSATTDDVEQE